MKIECTPKIGLKGILILLINEEPWCEIHTAIFGRKPQFPPADTLEILEETFVQLEYVGAMRVALQRLSFRLRLESDIREVLRKHLVTEKTTEKVIEACRELGYLQDSLWIESFVRNQLSRKNGPEAILHKLMQHKVPYDKAKEALRQFDNPALQEERIIRLLDTRYGRKDLSDFKTREKVIGALHRKGFSVSLIKRVISEKGVG